MNSRSWQSTPTAALIAGNVSPRFQSTNQWWPALGCQGKAGVLDDVTITVDLATRRLLTGLLDFRIEVSLRPQRVALENAKDGKVLEELLQTPDIVPGAHLETPWSDLQLAYFVGCAMWTYLNTPFLLVRPGVDLKKSRRGQEAGETWRRLKVRFPSDIATHSTEQTLYFDHRGLLKRHDYDVEISGGTPAAHYVSDLREFSGIVFPTKRRILPRQPDGHSAPEPLVVSIDLDQFVLS